MPFVGAIEAYRSGAAAHIVDPSNSHIVPKLTDQERLRGRNISWLAAVRRNDSCISGGGFAGIAHQRTGRWMAHTGSMDTISGRAYAPIIDCHIGLRISFIQPQVFNRAVGGAYR